jgi:hypothetical protein
VVDAFFAARAGARSPFGGAMFGALGAGITLAAARKIVARAAVVRS